MLEQSNDERDYLAGQESVRKTMSYNVSFLGFLITIFIIVCAGVSAFTLTKAQVDFNTKRIDKIEIYVQQSQENDADNRLLLMEIKQRLDIHMNEDGKK
jgi:hypothetical protein